MYNQVFSNRGGCVSIQKKILEEQMEINEQARSIRINN
jgi:hypothetical protein